MVPTPAVTQQLLSVGAINQELQAIGGLGESNVKYTHLNWKKQDSPERTPNDWSKTVLGPRQLQGCDPELAEKQLHQGPLQGQEQEGPWVHGLIGEGELGMYAESWCWVRDHLTSTSGSSKMPVASFSTASAAWCMSKGSCPQKRWEWISQV